MGIRAFDEFRLLKGRYVVNMSHYEESHGAEGCINRCESCRSGRIRFSEPLTCMVDPPIPNDATVDLWYVQKILDFSDTAGCTWRSPSSHVLHSLHGIKMLESDSWEDMGMVWMICKRQLERDNRISDRSGF